MQRYTACMVVVDAGAPRRPVNWSITAAARAIINMCNLAGIKAASISTNAGRLCGHVGSAVAGHISASGGRVTSFTLLLLLLQEPSRCNSRSSHADVVLLADCDNSVTIIHPCCSAETNILQRIISAVFDQPWGDSSKMTNYNWSRQDDK